LVTVGLIGCGGEQAEVAQVEPEVTVEEKTQGSMVRPSEVPAEIGERAEDWTAIQTMVDEVITRLSYGDKSGLYENEFSYLRAQETFDDYIKHGEVKWANTDSLNFVEIVNITFYGRDSALMNALFHLRSGNQQVEKSPMILMAYNHDGRWIRPYMSSIDRQLDYDKLIRQADDDTDEDW
jgi:hypothetical protein